MIAALAAMNTEDFMIGTLQSYACVEARLKEPNVLANLNTQVTLKLSTKNCGG